MRKGTVYFGGSDKKQEVINTKSAKIKLLFNIKLGGLTNYVYLCTCK